MITAHGLRAAANAKKGLQFVGGKAVSVAATTTPSTVLTNLTGGLAAAPAIGDIVIAAVAFKDATDRNITCTTTGYTEITDLFSNGINDIQLAVYRKTLTAADTSVAFDTVASVASRIAIHVWRGINATPLDVTSTTSTASGDPPNPPAITPVTNGCVIIAVGAMAGASGASLSDLTVPTGMENFFQVTASTVSQIGICSYLQAAADTYNPEPFGGGSTSNDNTNASVTIALRPA